MISKTKPFMRTHLLCLWIGLIGALAEVAAVDAAETRPNIVVILADDLGFSDLGCYGSQIATPNLDGLARHGIRFRQFHNASRCCPTRAALLTGKYPHEVGLRNNGASLSQEAKTLAEILAANGYRTAMAGKWHLTHAEALAPGGHNGAEHLAVLNNQRRVSWFGDRKTYPAARGFEQHYGVIWGIVNYFHPFALVDGFRPVYDLPQDYYLTDALNAKSVEFIREFANRDEPFFLYLAHTAPHWPLHAKPNDRAKYDGRFDAGWEALRKARYARQVAAGLIDPKIYPLPELDRGRRPEWSEMSPEQRERDAAKMETHAAMIDCMDQGLGRVFQALKDTGQLENTLIVFLSDNGASPEEPTRPGYDRPSETPDGRVIRYTGMIPAADLGADDTWTGLGPALANACNTPFRYWKKESYHGGCVTPCIVHWPNGVKAKPNSITDQVCHVTDLFPTVLEAAGIDPSPHGTRGRSLLPLLQGEAISQRGPLYFEHSGGAAMREDDWKIVRLTPADSWALFDLSRDRTETTDLSAKHPEVVARLDKAWRIWWREMTGEAAADQGPERAAPPTPRIAGKRFRVEAEVLAPEGNTLQGVVIAQGGIEHGYALHFIAGAPAFDVRVNGTVTRLIGSKSKGDRIRLTAALDESGMSLEANGRRYFKRSPGLLPVQPKDPLTVGNDSLTAAGNYTAPNPLRGKVLSARVRVAD